MLGLSRWERTNSPTARTVGTDVRGEPGPWTGTVHVQNARRGDPYAGAISGDTG